MPANRLIMCIKPTLLFIYCRHSRPGQNGVGTEAEAGARTHWELLLLLMGQASAAITEQMSCWELYVALLDLHSIAVFPCLAFLFSCCSPPETRARTCCEFGAKLTMSVYQGVWLCVYTKIIVMSMNILNWLHAAAAAYKNKDNGN